MLKRFFQYPRYLSDVLKSVDLDTIPAETTMALWDSIHSLDPNVVTKTLSSLQFKLIQERLEQAPSFIFPSSKLNKTLISEIIETNCLGFSDMESEDSNTLFILRMFPELASNKYIVPLRGDVVENSLKKSEAQQVLNCFCRFYLDTDLFSSYVLVFNENFDGFNYEMFMQEYMKPTQFIL